MIVLPTSMTISGENTGNSFVDKWKLNHIKLLLEAKFVLIKTISYRFSRGNESNSMGSLQRALSKEISTMEGNT
eukprot:snap_masked-scaffold_13-processed-gene-8.33-mRNA-1 protein AED:1.00 eAED:1.00 QI:0/-1/0/0/-1/1/1/0/73